MPNDNRQAVQNPFAGATPSPPRALVSVEQQRAIAEVQARMIIARTNPRDPIRATDAILQDCTRPTLAETALYEYTRGGSSVSGPSIRLVETMARRWGNIASGIKEIARHDDYSDCVAYAWDLETGFYDERQFQVRHWRDTKRGGHQLKDERDIYEMVANMGQRRKRAVLLAIIPGDVTEAAVAQCEETLRSTADTSPEALKKLLEAFSALGVTKEQLEERCQRHLEAIRPAQVVLLRKIYASLRDGMSAPADWFDPRGLTATTDELDDFAASQPATQAPEPAAGDAGSTERSITGDTAAEPAPTPARVPEDDPLAELLTKLASCATAAECERLARAEQRAIRGLNDYQRSRWRHAYTARLDEIDGRP